MNQHSQAEPQNLSDTQRLAVFILFFTSGFAGLVYEVLWMKELGLLFGNTSYATSATLAAFFLGIAGGGLVLGRYARNSKNPLKLYAMLEIAVSVTALLYFILLDIYHLSYSTIFELFEPGSAAFTGVKFILALSVLFPPAFFMGGTLPVMSQFLTRHQNEIGKTASLLYAINTFGATCGALAAGFYLPRLFGFTNSYLLAISLTSTVAIIAWLLSRDQAAPEKRQSSLPVTSGPSTDEITSIRLVQFLAFFSGFSALGLEVIWTRMFAQVLQNSVYTFAIILVVFLLALSCGAAIARWLISLRHSSTVMLFVLLSTSGLLIATTPWSFLTLTDGLAFYGKGLPWDQYITKVFMLALIVMLPPILVLGSLFPYLIRLYENQNKTASQTVGDLAFINTTGAVIGSIIAGFFMLDAFGLWDSIVVMSALYLLVAFLTLLLNSKQLVLIAVPVLIFIVSITLFNTIEKPEIALNIENNEELIELFEGSGATVAVIKSRDSYRIKVNNYYGIGGSADHKNEERQSHIPLLIHPEAKSVFYLGMGTGITAGAALQHPGVEKVVVTELLPDVVKATKKHFEPFLHGLYTDERATVIAEDGRNYLFGTDESFDLIIADLFIPWKAGTGTLYSKEHYTNAKKRLNAGGIYAQWLPMFQVSKAEFNSIARTMLSVFPDVTVWRSKFQGKVPIMLLAGHTATTPLNPDLVKQRLTAVDRDEPAKSGVKAIGREALPFNTAQLLMHYGGTLRPAESLFADSPINTDNRPFVEYNAPIAHARKKSGQQDWFRAEPLINFYELLLKITPPEKDPYLLEAGPARELLVKAGLELHRARVYSYLDNHRGFDKAMLNFSRHSNAAENRLTN